LLVPAGCAKDVPFELADVDFADDRTLVLTFTKHVASVEAVDPLAFRISLARFDRGMSEGTTQYYEPGSFGLVEDCLEGCYYDYLSQENVCEQHCPGTPGLIVVESIENARHNKQRVLVELSNAIGKPQCEWIDESRGEHWDAGFVVHYDAEIDPPLTSEHGDSLDSIMEHWVIGSDDFVEVDDRFPHEPGADPIPCPR
jgi:hypothetical protein